MKEHNDDMLEMYALYKQGTSGDCNTGNKITSRFRVVRRIVAVNVFLVSYLKVTDEVTDKNICESITHMITIFALVFNGL